ncbi:MAG: hypothetical protein HPY50_04540 [Firmicutes bacterium]|nr:hypothetical protein [Bacillota bacterium]
MLMQEISPEMMNILRPEQRVQWAKIEVAVTEGKSVVALDAAGETYRQLAGKLRERGYEVLVLNASYADARTLNFNESIVNWNPIIEIRDNSEMELFVSGIVKNNHVEFNLLAGLESMLLKSLVHIVKSGAFPQKINTMLSLLNLAKENIISIFEDLYEDGRFTSDECSILKHWLTSLPISDIDKASENLISKLSRLNKYESFNAMDNLIDFTRLGREKTAVFVQTPLILDFCNKKVVSLMTAFLLRRLYDTADQTGGRLSVAVSVFLDDTEHHIDRIPGLPEIVEKKPLHGIV